MPIAEGSHTQPPTGTPVHWRAEYEVVGNVIRYSASFGTASANSTHEGQFDFDASKLDAADAVEAFMANHIAKSDFDDAP